MHWGFEQLMSQLPTPAVLQKGLPAGLGMQHEVWNDRKKHQHSVHHCPAGAQGAQMLGE